MSPPKNNETAHTIRRGAHADVPTHDNRQRQHFTNKPSASSKNVDAAAVNPCVDGDFPNVDFHDNDLVSAVVTLHTPDEQFGLVLVPDGTNAEHAESDCDLNLAMFSREESVMVDLLMTLKKLHAPMKSYSEILKWAVRSQLSGYAFRDVPQTSRSVMLGRMQQRMNLQSLVPIQKDLYLPYSKTTIKVINLMQKLYSNLF